MSVLDQSNRYATHERKNCQDSRENWLSIQKQGDRFLHALIFNL